MEVGTLLIGEEQVRFPDGVQHRRVQVQRVVGVLAVGQPGVVPLLPQENVHSVVLQGDTVEAVTDTSALLPLIERNGDTGIDEGMQYY